MTVREVVSSGRLAQGGLFGPLRRRDRAIVDEAIADVGLGDLADARLGDLSGGQQQRAFIAKAFAGEPSLLVLDEPTAGVDAESQEALARLLGRLHADRGVTTLYVSHEFGAVEGIVERLVLVRGGIVFDGPPHALPSAWHDPRMPMLESEFMRLAFATGAVVGLLAPAVGFFLVQRNMSLVGDGVGHTAFAGVAAGYLLGVEPVLTALVAAVAGAVGIEWLRSRHRAAGDQALALLFYTGLAAGVVLASSAGALDVDLFSFLFGSILTVTRGDLILVAVLGVAGLLLIGLLYRALAAVVIDEEGARVAGVPVAALNVLVAGLAGVTIGLSMQIVGILLIAALMVLPVIAAGRVAWSMGSSVLLAMGIGLLSVFAGLTVAYYADLPPGGAIVLLAAAAFVVTSALEAVRARA